MKFILGIFIIIFSLNIHASTIDLNQFTPFLTNMQSIAVDFIQTDSKNANILVNGTLLINKPYKFRCNYYPPFPLLIIGNKNYLSVYDYDMETIYRQKASENIFNFLLLDSADLSKYFKIKMIEDLPDVINLTLEHIETGKHSIITFNKDLKQISKIQIIELDNIITLSFASLQQVRKFDKDLFIIKNPDIFGPPNRLNKEELENKLTIQ